MLKKVGIPTASLLLVVAAIIGVITVFGNAADPGNTVNVTVDPVNPLKVTLNGNWIWDSQSFPCIDSRWVGWAIDWGDFNGNFVQSKGQAAGVGFHVGSPTGVNTDDNTVSTNKDCGTSATGTGKAQGTWGPITHTYSAPGNYQICALMYDIHNTYTDTHVDLSGAINASQTTINLTAADSIANLDDLKVENEFMRVIAGGGTTTLTVIRGFSGSTAAAHNSGKAVSKGAPNSGSLIASGSPHNGDNSAETNSFNPAAGSSGGQCAATLLVIPNPALTVAKSSTTSSLSAPGTVSYSYLVTNTGNVTLTGIALVDDNSDAAPVCLATTLAPSATTTCTATHTFTQAELDANGSPAAGSGLLTNNVTASSNQGASDTDTLNIPITPNPAMTVAKSSTTSSLSAPGTVTYSYLLTNTGNVTLTGISLVDDNTNAAPSCLATTLAPAATTTCSATHTFTQAELDADGSPAPASASPTTSAPARARAPAPPTR